MDKRDINFFDYHLRINARSPKEKVVVDMLNQYRGTVNALITSALYEYLKKNPDEFTYEYDADSNDESTVYEVENIKRRKANDLKRTNNIQSNVSSNSNDEVMSETEVKESGFDNEVLDENVFGLLDGLSIFDP